MPDDPRRRDLEARRAWLVREVRRVDVGVPIRTLRRRLMGRWHLHRNTASGDIEAILGLPGFELSDDGRNLVYLGSTDGSAGA